MFEAREIWKAYRPATVLHGASISVERGSATVLIGPSGSGKSTLLRTASLIDLPDRGMVIVDGVSRFDSHRIHHSGAQFWPEVTVVPQQLFLWPHLTVRTNIVLPTTLRGKSDHELSAVCTSLGIQDVLDRYPNQVSIGQRQRAAVARALLLRPHYLMLDEITASLDVEQIEKMLDVLEQYLDRGMGLIVVTHQLGFARSLMGRGTGGQFAFMDGGIILETGDVARFDNPQTQRLSQFRRAMLAIA